MAYNIRQNDPRYDPLEAQLAEYFEAGRRSATEANDAARRNIESLIQLREVRQANREREIADREARTRIRMREVESKSKQANRRLKLGETREAERSRRAREQLEARKARDAELARERAGARQQRAARDAQTQAYRNTVLQQRQTARRTQSARRLAGALPSGTTSGRSTGIAPTGGGWSPDKGSTAKFIIFATGLAAIVSVATDVGGTPEPRSVTTNNGVTIKVPRHLRAFGGVFVAGAIALLLNEFMPAAGVLLGAGILFIVVVPGAETIFGTIGGNVFGGGLKAATAPKGGGSAVNPNTPASQAIVSWIEGHPGKLPFPNPKNDTEKFWNTFAQNTAYNKAHGG